MLSAASRNHLRASLLRGLVQSQPLSRRSISFGPPPKKRGSWKGTAARWGVAVGAIYVYNTSDFFSEYIASLRERIARVRQSDDPLSLAEPFTVGRRDHQPALYGGPAPSNSLRQSVTDRSNTSPAESFESPSALSSAAPQQAASPDGSAPTQLSPDPGDPEELEEEADSQGAFNPETGEINWDCPCLGGMAHGTCGPEFKAAFSCFVYSKEEQKGIDCIDKFKGMQDCFRAHPEEYADELGADPTEDDAADSAMAEPGAASAQSAPNASQSPSTQHSPQQATTSLASDPAPAPYSGATSPASEVPGSNLTSTPSASPTSLSSSTEVPSSAASKSDADQKRELR